MANPELEYNLAGGLLLTLREGDFRKLQEGLAESGYRYGCVLPFRSLKKDGIKQLKKSPLQVIHIEEAWNPTSEDNLARAILAGLVGYWKRYRGDTDLPPIVQDAFFPAKSTCDRLFTEIIGAFPGVKFISHGLDVSFPHDRLLVEINRGINLSSEEILSRAEEKGFGLVFDPRHLLFPERVISQPDLPTRQSRGEWERQFRAFPGKVEVVDINPPSKDDVAELLAGRGVLRELAQAAKEEKVKFLRVEIPIPPLQQLPGFPFHKKGFEFIREIGEALQG